MQIGVQVRENNSFQQRQSLYSAIMTVSNTTSAYKVCKVSALQADKVLDAVRIQLPSINLTKM